MKVAKEQLQLDFDDAPPGREQFVDKPTAGSEMKRILADLNAEFDRINDAYFKGECTRPAIEFSKRKTFGGYYQKARHRIVLSWQACLEHGWEEVLNTFRHEVAHIAHQNHGAEFWKLAIALGVTKKYAASPLTPRRTLKPLYVYSCPACGGLVRRRKRLRNASCGRCDKSYNPRFKLRLVKEEKESG
jgi:predicted SprT family Zn-dependent metalloprotease